MEKELTGNYPIIIDGRETGRISVDREGLFWCFEASSEMCDGIIRLSVYGDGKEGYLGVMEPRGNGLRLRRKLSRAGLTAFPNSITHGGRQGEPQDSLLKEEITESTENTSDEPSCDAPADGGGDCQEDCAGDEGELPPQYEKPPPEPKTEAASPLIWKFCGCPCSYLSSLEAKSIFGSQKNVLEARDGEYIYLALPESSGLDPAQQNLFTGRAHILGSPHLICRIKNGKIV